MTSRCGCTEAVHRPRLVVLTGGPGAGKTAVLEFVQRTFCQHVVVLPESAGIIFGGGFPRRSGRSYTRGAQRAIFHVQRELERIALEEGHTGLVLCDRGTIDGAAYWPDGPPSLFDEVGVEREEELLRYAAVIHLHPPPEGGGYNHQNPLRIESAREAAEIDVRIKEAWAGHPHRRFVDRTRGFMEKVAHALELIRAELPACCQKPAQPVTLALP